MSDNMIAIIDYGAGNVRSVLNMLKALNLPARSVHEGDALKEAERIILPGVGHFDHGMAQLEARGFIPMLNEMVIGCGVPLLGICLGAQLLARRSDEGHRPGLGWVAADVVAFDRTLMGPELRVPHMGWAETWIAPDASLPAGFAALPEEARFYYVHSYHLACDDPRRAVAPSG